MAAGRRVVLSSAMMKPTIGRIVHYHPHVANDASASAEELARPLPIFTYAALVIAVKEDGGPSLHVFTPDNGNYQCNDAKFSDVPAMGCWTWPPRA